MLDWIKEKLAHINFGAVVDTVRKVETTLKNGTPAEKKALAVELINEAVDIPILPESAEAVLFGLLVDFVVYLYNRWWGHDWLKKLIAIQTAQG